MWLKMGWNENLCWSPWGYWSLKLHLSSWRNPFLFTAILRRSACLKILLFGQSGGAVGLHISNATTLCSVSSASTAPPPVCSPAGPSLPAATATLAASPAFGTMYPKNAAAIQEIPEAPRDLSLLCSCLTYPLFLHGEWPWQCCQTAGF